MFYYLSTMITGLINRFKLIPATDHKTDKCENPFFPEFPLNVVPCPENNFGLSLFGRTDH